MKDLWSFQFHTLSVLRLPTVVRGYFPSAGAMSSEMIHSPGTVRHTYYNAPRASMARMTGEYCRENPGIFVPINAEGGLDGGIAPRNIFNPASVVF